MKRWRILLAAGLTSVTALFVVVGPAAAQEIDNDDFDDDVAAVDALVDDEIEDAFAEVDDDLAEIEDDFGLDLGFDFDDFDVVELDTDDDEDDVEEDDDEVEDDDEDDVEDDEVEDDEVEEDD